MKTIKRSLLLNPSTEFLGVSLVFWCFTGGAVRLLPEGYLLVFLGFFSVLYYLDPAI